MRSSITTNVRVHLLVMRSIIRMDSRLLSISRMSCIVLGKRQSYGRRHSKNDTSGHLSCLFGKRNMVHKPSLGSVGFYYWKPKAKPAVLDWISFNLCVSPRVEYMYRDELIDAVDYQFIRVDPGTTALFWAYHYFISYHITL